MTQVKENIFNNNQQNEQEDDLFEIVEESNEKNENSNLGTLIENKISNEKLKINENKNTRKYGRKKQVQQKIDSEEEFLQESESSSVSRTIHKIENIADIPDLIEEQNKSQEKEKLQNQQKIFESYQNQQQYERFENFQQKVQQFLIKHFCDINIGREDFLIFLVQEFFFNDFDKAWDQIQKRPKMFGLMAQGYFMYDDQLIN